MPALSAPEGAPVTPDPPGYPRELERDVVTGGLHYRVRPIRPDDGKPLVQFHARLSPRSVYLRFFSAHPVLSEKEVTRFTAVDYDARLALVATADDHLIGVARYDRAPGASEAEVAFVVDDEYQHHGIGSELLDELADAALARGVTVFRAETLAENRTMLDCTGKPAWWNTSSMARFSTRVSAQKAFTPRANAASASSSSNSEPTPWC